MSLILAIAQHVRTNNLGEVFGPDTGFKLAESPDTVRAPDIAFVSKLRIPPGGIPEKFWPGAPDLAVEVVSPSDTLYELDEKIDEYLSTGVRAVWVVNPKNRTVTVYSSQTSPRILKENDALDGGEVLPGFHYKVSKLFSRRDAS